MWRFHDQVFINYLVARFQKQGCSAPRAFSHSFCPQNISGAENYRFFQRIWSVSEIKPKMRDVFAKMREGWQNAWFPARLRDGWHLCKLVTSKLFSLVLTRRCSTDSYISLFTVFPGGITDGVLRIGSTEMPVYDTESKMKVPDVLFYDNHQVRLCPMYCFTTTTRWDCLRNKVNLQLPFSREVFKHCTCGLLADVWNDFWIIGDRLVCESVDLMK